MTEVDQVKALLMVDGTPFKVASGAVSLAAALKSGPKAVPAAFVFLGREASAENARMTGPVSQRQERDLSVVYVTGNRSDATGEATSDEMETLKAFSRGQLIGRVLEGVPSGEPLTHVEGAIASFEHGFAWYEDVFSTPTYLTEQGS